MFCIRIMIPLARSYRWVLVVALLGVRSMGFALPAKCGAGGGGPMPAPLSRLYRQEPEEERISQITLLKYFKDHPVVPKEPVCVTLPGHKPPTPGLRAALRATGMLVDPRDDCRFEEGRTLWKASGVWQVQPGVFKAHVVKAEFGHVNVFLEGYEYTVRKVDGAWAVTAVEGSACNPAARR